MPLSAVDCVFVVFPPAQSPAWRIARAHGPGENACADCIGDIPFAKENDAMPHHTFKHIKVTGTSADSMEDAMHVAVEKAAQTVRNMRWFTLVETRGRHFRGKGGRMAGDGGNRVWPGRVIQHDDHAVCGTKGGAPMHIRGSKVLSLALAAFWAAWLHAPACAAVGHFGPIRVAIGGQQDCAASASLGGLSLVAPGEGAQLAVMEPTATMVVSVAPGQKVEVTVPVSSLEGPCELSAEADLVQGTTAQVDIWVGAALSRHTLLAGETAQLTSAGHLSASVPAIRLATAGLDQAIAVRLRRLRVAAGEHRLDIPLRVTAPPANVTPPPLLPNLDPPIQQVLVEWDWRLQDGVGTPRRPAVEGGSPELPVGSDKGLPAQGIASYREAIQQTLARGDQLLGDLQAAGVPLEELSKKWQVLRQRWQDLPAAELDDTRWEDLWGDVHRLRREIALSNPLARVGPLLLVKQPAAMFSHQLTQYLGRYARPGGGLFVLDWPGQSMDCRQLAPGALPEGSYQHAEVSYEGDRILFAYCRADAAPSPTLAGQAGRHFHLYEIAVDGSQPRQLTAGPFDDFSPRYLPNGQIVFISTRRGGWHRCGGSPGQGCENHTLALAEADGSQASPISFHETHEWDPAVLHDGRVIYTRWDYVDRHAVYYEQLWTTRPDGTSAAIYFGNNTLNPVGIWEAQPVPGSSRVMATAAAHHAMTAGSIILVDVGKGVDGLQSIVRLTPDAPFPESETSVAPGGWHAPDGIQQARPVPAEAMRWPGHCYKSPYPLSETYFLAAYSFQALIGEPDANPVNMFGVYLVDRFGNKELLYRDLNISSVWPVPLRSRPRPRGGPGDQAIGGRAPGGLFRTERVRQRSAPATSIGSAAAHRASATQVHTGHQLAAGRFGQRLAGKAGVGDRPRRSRWIGLFPGPRRYPPLVPGLGCAGPGPADHAQRRVSAAGRDHVLHGVPRTAAHGCRAQQSAAALAGPPAVIEPARTGQNPSAIRCWCSRCWIGVAWSATAHKDPRGRWC